MTIIKFDEHSTNCFVYMLPLIEFDQLYNMIFSLLASCCSYFIFPILFQTMLTTFTFKDLAPTANFRKALTDPVLILSIVYLSVHWPDLPRRGGGVLLSFSFDLLLFLRHHFSYFLFKLAQETRVIIIPKPTISTLTHDLEFNCVDKCGCVFIINR